MSAFVRNLIFHCYAPANTLSWRANCAAVAQHAGQFDGRRIVAVVTAPGLHPPEAIRPLFPGGGWEFLTFPNDPSRAEGVTLRPLLEAVADPDPQQILFRCHTKGAALHRHEEYSARWRDGMYRACLSDPAAVDVALAGHAVAGAYRQRLPNPGPDSLRRRGHFVPWYFAGSFWWARHDRLFGDGRWKGLDFDNPYVAEALPGALFDHGESACLFWDDWPGGNADPHSYGPYLDR